jgi:hypothetical protein
MTLIATLASMSTMVNAIGPAFTSIGQTAMKMWANLKQFVFDKFGKPVMEKLGEIKEWWTGFKETVIEKWQGIKDFINDNVVTPIQEKWQGIKDFISDNVVDPIKEKWGTLKEWFTGFKATVIEKWVGIKTFINERVINPILEKWEIVKGFFGGLKEEAILKIQGIKDFFSTKISEIWDKLPSLPEIFTLAFWTGLATDIGTALGGIGESLVGGLKGSINILIGLLNDLLAGVNFSKTISNPFTGTEYSFGFDISDWKIPELAKGGIVNKPTLAMIGEDGPEAVVPLSQRNNPGGAGMGGGTYNITVNAGGITDRTDKRALAREIGNMIQQELARSIGGSTMRGRY